MSYFFENLSIPKGGRAQKRSATICIFLMLMVVMCSAHSQTQVCVVVFVHEWKKVDTNYCAKNSYEV